MVPWNWGWMEHETDLTLCPRPESVPNLPHNLSLTQTHPRLGTDRERVGGDPLTMHQISDSRPKTGTTQKGAVSILLRK